MNSQIDFLANQAGFESISVPGADIKLWRNYLNARHSEQLFRYLVRNINFKQETLNIAGRQLQTPRLTAFYGEKPLYYSYSGLTTQAVLWPDTLARLAKKVGDDCGCVFNSVVLNYYRDGNDSMGYHSDDEHCLGRNPVIASLSLGEERRFLLKPKAGIDSPDLLHERSRSIPLGNGSLLLMAGATQHNWQHAVPKQLVSHSGRINLTFRAIGC